MPTPTPMPTPSTKQRKPRPARFIIAPGKYHYTRDGYGIVADRLGPYRVIDVESKWTLPGRYARGVALAENRGEARRLRDALNQAGDLWKAALALWPATVITTI